MIPETRNNWNSYVQLQVFGCQMNKLDSELIRSLLAEEGYHFTENPDEAGTILFVTCSVREHAEDRVHSRIGMLKPWKKKNPHAVLAVLGCMAQEHGEKLIARHPHLDLVVGTRDFPNLPELLRQARDGHRGMAITSCQEAPEVLRDTAQRPFRQRAFLAVMRGCQMYCAYCVVPYVRGPEVSRDANRIVEEAQALVSDGVVEITLLGQSVNRYDDGSGCRLPGLIRRLDLLPGLQRLNFVTSYPAFVDDELILAMAECRSVTRYLHLPVQSGSDLILEKMKRRYTAGEYLDTVKKLREAMPDLELGSDFIVGFPGETDDDFRCTKSVMEQVRFQQAFIFKYSPRPGTLAARNYTDTVPEEVKKERNARLLALQEKISREKNAATEGHIVEVLVEGQSPRDPARYIGRTIYNQIVAFPASDNHVGKRVRVRVETSTPLTLLGSDDIEVVS
ncbi:MAG: tRNA (N6-isopentenyl adenosine(37)-C2)-methylthiotransferase MiaB [Planctomycetota bacterium]